MILLKAFNSKGAVLLPGVQYREIVPEGIYLINQAGHEEFLEADSILLAAGSLPNQRIIDQAKGKTKEQLYIIGDNFQPRNIKSAVHDGARTGRQI
jgi:2,4-dienoyl-CoA reductase (NADPH2)